MNNKNEITVAALGSGSDFIKTFENLKEYLRIIDDVRIKNVYMEELTLAEALKSHDDILNWDLSFKFDSFHEAALMIERMSHEVPEKFIRIAVITKGDYISINDIHGDGLLDQPHPGKTSEEVVRKIVKSLEINQNL